ncbi:rhamnogalacturonan acetylesterase [Neobacillus sp. SuZ13]|uniref:rhamnogalacturonan acetylesterase n=1 Tax=Neobacillus sp. SuZ13 TaxID=3047875 RepID=UPI0024BFB37F|nr:rhamnogalacturonan acetylesterase [Neobacillus sp. SuZ13]WHY69923.1 rhamnogalacturonan acetylesterase [Neobacillus sp. SuZ13]
MVNNEYPHKNHITVYLAGDSTVSDYSCSFAPRAGWGQFIHRYFDNTIVVRNAATPGRSSKSFIAEGRLESILKQIKKGDYLLIQFGHNDEKMYKPSRYTEPYTTYKSYLKQYIDGARAKQAIPVLVTPVERRSFTDDGRARNSHGEYPRAMKELGLEEHVPVIDLTAKSRVLFQELGPDRTKDVFLWLDPGENKNYPKGVQDNTHFQVAGAKEIARLVVEGIKESNMVTLQDRLKK